MLTLFCNRSLAFEIALVANNNDREIILVLDTQNLLLERHDFFE